MISQVYSYIRTAYAEKEDMTFIIRESCRKSLAYGMEEIVGESTEVIGFYWGEPNEESTEKYIGKLKAGYGC